MKGKETKKTNEKKEKRIKKPTIRLKFLFFVVSQQNKKRGKKHFANS